MHEKEQEEGTGEEGKKEGEKQSVRKAFSFPPFASTRQIVMFTQEPLKVNLETWLRSRTLKVVCFISSESYINDVYICLSVGKFFNIKGKLRWIMEKMWVCEKKST